MRLCVLSDIHANFTALNAVLEHLGGDIDRIVSIGDTVGYGPDPKACLQCVTELCEVTLSGNHDQAVCGHLSTHAFSSMARAAVLWTMERLNREEKETLCSWPLDHAEPRFTLFHASLHPSNRWGYVQNATDAAQQFAQMSTDVGIFGHTHIPAVYQQARDGSVLQMHSSAMFMKSGNRYLINAGSVGQPRDGDARACALIIDFDTGLVQWERVSYHLEEVQARLQDAHLPEALMFRLALGR